VTAPAFCLLLLRHCSRVRYLQGVLVLRAFPSVAICMFALLLFFFVRSFASFLLFLQAAGTFESHRLMPKVVVSRDGGCCAGFEAPPRRTFLTLSKLKVHWFGRLHLAARVLKSSFCSFVGLTNHDLQTPLATRSLCTAYCDSLRSAVLWFGRFGITRNVGTAAGYRFAAGR
jgi:hypothetical protein